MSEQRQLTEVEKTIAEANNNLSQFQLPNAGNFTNWEEYVKAIQQ